MESPAESLAHWSTPECPFAIEYVPHVLDDIRLSVVDAFFSLPRGGAEIGGILMGRQDEGRVVITDAIPVECEHAFGPSFTLSETDLAHFGARLADALHTVGSKPVGWYHSHTRSEISLSDADVAIHKRFFPEAWQVALVLKPHTFLPTRAGFFFRGQDGAIRADASYQEFQLDPLPIGKLPSEEPPPRPPAVAAAAPSERVIDISRAARPEPAEPSTPIPPREADPKPEPQTAEEPPVQPAVAKPLFMMDEPAETRRWLAPVAIVAGLALGASGFLLRQVWKPRPAAVMPTGIVMPGSVGLTVSDRDGELQIRWDAKASDVQRSSGAMLFLTDGEQTRSMALDPAQVRSGSYAYKRTTDRVEVILSLGEPGGDKLVQAAGFVKPPAAPAPPPAAATAPAPTPAAADAALRKERDELRAENASLKAANLRLTESNKRMERYIETDRAERQRKRMENQSSDGK